MDAERLHEIFQPYGPVSVRRLFGGFGIYDADLIIAVFLRGELMFKGDDETAPLFAAVGSAQWSYTREGRAKATFMPFWPLPESAYDDEDELVKWAKLALGAAQRRERAKKVVKKKRK